MLPNGVGYQSRTTIRYKFYTPQKTTKLVVNDIEYHVAGIVKILHDVLQLNLPFVLAREDILRMLFQ